jgi:hypothetical protein
MAENKDNKNNNKQAKLRLVIRNKKFSNQFLKFSKIYFSGSQSAMELSIKFRKV